MIGIMSPTTLDELWDDGAYERRFDTSEVLFRAGDPVRLFYRVVDGTVALMRPLAHGSDLVLQRARAGDVLAEASLFAAAYHCDAVATSPARLRSIPVERVTAALERRPELAWSIAAYLAAEVQAARARAEIVSLKTVATRLDAWLALKGEALPPKGRWRELAAEIGVSPEALYRELATRRG